MLELSITITGKTTSDLEYSLDEVKRLVSKGFLLGRDSNDSAGLCFSVTGEEEEEEENDDDA